MWWNQRSWPFLMLKWKIITLSSMPSKKPRSYTLLYSFTVKHGTHLQNFQDPQSEFVLHGTVSSSKPCCRFQPIFSCLWWIHLLSACCPSAGGSCLIIARQTSSGHVPFLKCFTKHCTLLAPLQTSLYSTELRMSATKFFSIIRN